MDDENKSYPIPAKFRASLDMTDEAAFALLQKNDAAQKILSEQIQSPFTRSSPRELYRRKAHITIETLLKARLHQPLSDAQIEQLAESYAALGRYDLAADWSKANQAHYAKIWQAVFRDNDEWCEHGDARKFVSEYIWSFRENKEVALLKCGICGFLNAAEKPAHLVAASKARAQHQGQTANMTNAQIQQYHQTNVKKG